MSSFYNREGEGFRPTTMTRGPWDENFQHGGPPSGLLLREMAATIPEGFAVARVSYEILRPVPLGLLHVEVGEASGGRQVQRVQARLRAGERTLIEATGLFVRQAEDANHATAVRPGSAPESWPEPESLKRFVFPFFRWEEGYHQAVDVRVVDEPWGTTPIRCWARTLVDLVDDEPPTPEEMAVVLADAESGMGPPLDIRGHTFVNPDLTVYFARRPALGWVGLHITSRADGAGVGLSESELRDAAGPFGRSAQALVVNPR